MIGILLLLCAAACFLLSTIGVGPAKPALVPLGLLFVTLYFLFGAVPTSGLA